MNNRRANHLSIQFNPHLSSGTTADDVHAHGERVMQELLELEQCNGDFTDSTVSTDTNANTITIELLIFDLTEPAQVLQRARHHPRGSACGRGCDAELACRQRTAGSR